MPGYLPTLYKARGMPLKQNVCMICVERTRGKTQLVRLSHGVTVWLCAGHASHEFQTQRSGRDFGLTLQRLWQASGCLTVARRRALDAHLEAQRAPAPSTRTRPGSYAWPALRAKLETAFAKGAHPEPAARGIGPLFTGEHMRAPSRNTVRRWHREQRWLARAAAPPPDG